MNAATRARLTGTRSRTPLMRLIEAAAQERVTRRPGQFWDEYAVNDITNPDARPLVAEGFREGWLVDTDPTAATSRIEATTAGLARIGATR